MTSDTVRIRVRIGANEVEIEAPQSDMKEAIDLIPELTRRLPEEVESRIRKSPTIPQEIPQGPEPRSRQFASTFVPEIKVSKDDSLANVITKLFRESWGRQPRRLGDVREVLESYGLIYPKQSVAVALLRLAQSGKLRRFKGEEGDFVYTASTSLFTYAMPQQREEKVNAEDGRTGDTLKDGTVA